jgi:hypothetical protein
MTVYWRGAWAAAWVLGLAACGGGGSDSGADKGTGLVPPPPALGATLYADATVLRPLVPGATWQYEGTDSSGASHANTVTQASHAVVGVTETHTNYFNTGAFSVHLSAVNGSILQLDSTDQNGNFVDMADVIELRSPVRVNDQVVLVDKHIPDAYDDSDGDGRSEAADMALYARVIGTEELQVDGQAQQAVRIDRVLVVRAVMSKTGMTQNVFTDTLSTWYVPSVGIVRRQDTFEMVGAGTLVSEEHLVGSSGLH